MSGIALVLLNSFCIAALSSLIGIGINFVRPDSLPFIAARAYEVFVPCPEPLKEVNPVSPDILNQKKPNTLFIDARPESLFNRQHVLNALNIKFDYLYPVPDSALRAVIESKAHRIIVYGDGKKPDTGHELARELAGRGIKNVEYVKGGFDNIHMNLKENK